MATFPLDIKAEAVLSQVFGGGVFGSGVFGDPPWQDITADVYQRDPIVIGRGRANESAQTEASTCQLTIDNRSGDYSPRNPNGANYGTLGRNTPFRVTVPGENVRLILRDRDADAVTAPDSAGLSVTGDIDVRAEFDLDSWYGGDFIGFVGKWEETGDQRSYWFGLVNSQDFDPLTVPQTALRFVWSSDGTNAGSRDGTATAPIPHPATGRLAVRATLDVNNGAGGCTVTFYTSDAIDGTWTQLGDPIIDAGTTSIFDSTADVKICQTIATDIDDATDRRFAYVEGFAVEIRNGIAGSVVASPDFTAQTTEDTSFTDAQGNTWTLEGGAELTNRLTRFSGEVAAWPQRWDSTGRDVYAPIEAAGILRRLAQGGVVPSPIYSEMLLEPFQGQGETAFAYWPCESGNAVTAFPSAITGHRPGTIAGAPPAYTVDSEFNTSGDLVQFGGSRWTFRVPPYAATGSNLVSFHLGLPSTIAAETRVATIRTTGNVVQLDFYVNTSGNFRLYGFDSSGATVADTGYGSDDLRGKKVRMAIDTYDATTAVTWTVVQEDENDGAFSGGADLVGGLSGGAVTQIVLNPDGGLTDTSCGHVAVHNDENVQDLLWVEAMCSYSGETAVARAERLCRLTGIPFTFRGDGHYSTPMGRQGKKNIVELLRECATADGGILFEPREFVGIGYVTKDALSAREPVLELGYSEDDLSDIQPVEDDQATANDVTVTRVDGASIRRTQTDGPLGSDTIGTQDKSETVNISTDDDLPHQASWRLHVGTIDEARYPTIGVNLARRNFTTDAALSAATQEADIGDKIAITNPPSWLPPDDIRQLVQGVKETVTKFEWLIDVNCSPAAPWDVGVYDAETGEEETRYESDGSSLSAAVNTSATSLTVATPTGPVWTDVDGPFDIFIGGERMTVTAIAGATTPQTFTVTRAVNGVSKSHPAGAEVRLFKPAYYAL